MVLTNAGGPHRLQQRRRAAAPARRPQARGAGSEALLADSPAALREALERQRRHAVHHGRRRGSARSIISPSARFLLNAQPHQLVLLKQLTRELAAQEVAVWKKVIRVIAHELNNSLAPIRSLAHSGRLLAAGDQTARRSSSGCSPRSASAPRIWPPSSRAMRASPSCRGRARRPSPGRTCWRASRRAQPFRIEGSLPQRAASFDVGQLEQVMINLLKNAAESGSARGADHGRCPSPSRQAVSHRSGRPRQRAHRATFCAMRCCRSIRPSPPAPASASRCAARSWRPTAGA